jgi:hypothetical protein
MNSPEKPVTDFEKAARASEESLLVEFWGFLRENKKWWLLPLLIVLMMMGVLIVLGSTGASSFLYTLF